KESDFYDKVKSAIVFKTTKGEYLTLQEYKDRNGEKTKDSVVYVTNEKQQAQYLMLTDEQNVDAVLMGARIDNPFMSYLESNEQENLIRFIRIDSDLSSILKEDAPDEWAFDAGILTGMFKTALHKDKLEVKAEPLKNSDVPAIVTLPEESRRMQEMSKMFGSMNASIFDAFESKEQLVLNSRNSLIRALYAAREDEAKKADIDIVCNQLYDLAVMSHRQLSAEDINRFVARSAEILTRLL
ncbi:MAG: molecular chaperone HtpG, partial [Clostridiales bacterium]|nr:molecular chaperone HtpG [Clostridiales bacterium]